MSTIKVNSIKNTSTDDGGLAIVLLLKTELQRLHNLKDHLHLATLITKDLEIFSEIPTRQLLLTLRVTETFVTKLKRRTLFVLAGFIPLQQVI